MDVKSKIMNAIIAVYAMLFSNVNTKAKSIWSNTRASAGSVIGKILGLVVGGYVAGSTLPDSITMLTNATSWANTPAVVQTLGTTVLGIIMIVAFIYLLLKEAGIGD